MIEERLDAENGLEKGLNENWDDIDVGGQQGA
jgi:hypothetical protein